MLLQAIGRPWTSTVAVPVMRPGPTGRSGDGRHAMSEGSPKAQESAGCAHTLRPPAAHYGAAMTNMTDAERLAALEKRVGEMSTLLHFQDSKRVEIEKAIGAIDQQLIKTEAGLNQVRVQLAPKAKKKAKPAAKAKSGKAKAKAKKRK